MSRLINGRIVLLLIAVVVALTTTPMASAAQCLNDGAGGATHGAINYNINLQYAYINESNWSGDGSYHALRRYSNGETSYIVFIGGGGTWQYGTSGNAYRGTSINPYATTLYTWYVLQYSIC